jgi:hypothetical protein
MRRQRDRGTDAGRTEQIMTMPRVTVTAVLLRVIHRLNAHSTADCWPAAL